MRRATGWGSTAWLLVAVVAAAGAEQRPLEFKLTFDPVVSREPFTGRVYVMLSKQDPGQRVRSSPNWFKPDPMFALDVKDWKPGTPLTIGAAAIAYPEPLAKLAKGTYYAQGFMDFGRGMSFTAGPGNGWC